ncbi:hypothetical protein GCM10029992_17580 [Glycomyces albus]
MLRRLEVAVHVEFVGGGEALGPGLDGGSFGGERRDLVAVVGSGGDDLEVRPEAPVPADVDVGDAFGALEAAGRGEQDRGDELPLDRRVVGHRQGGSGQRHQRLAFR